MRSNVFKKALILAAAAFVTAVIGVGGAKLKVQAVTDYTSGHAVVHYSPHLSSDLAQNDTIKAGVEIWNADSMSSPHGASSNDVYIYPHYYTSTNVLITSLDGTSTVSDYTVASYTGVAYWIVTSIDDSLSGQLTINFKAVDGFEVVYKNDDGTVLQSDTVVSGAATPTYAGTPTKTASAQYTYTFSGWDTDPSTVPTVTADATYTAQYTPTIRSYNITWKNDDGSVLRTDSVAYGSLPSYGGTPSKPDDANYTYTFSMWNPTVQLVTGDATYTAVYLADPIPPIGGGSSDEDSSSSSSDGSNSGDSSNSGGGSNTTGTDGSTTGNRAPKTADTMPGIIVIALAGLLGGALLITGSRKSSK